MQLTNLFRLNEADSADFHLGSQQIIFQLVNLDSLIDLPLCLLNQVSVQVLVLFLQVFIGFVDLLELVEENLLLLAQLLGMLNFFSEIGHVRVQKLLINLVERLLPREGLLDHIVQHANLRCKMTAYLRGDFFLRC